MSASGAAAFTDGLLRSLFAEYDGPARLRLYPEPERPAILDAGEGDLITVVQPDGAEDVYRLARKTVTEDGLGFSYECEPVPPEGSDKG